MPIVKKYINEKRSGSIPGTVVKKRLPDVQMCSWSLDMLAQPQETLELQHKQSKVSPQGADPPPLPLHVAKAG